MSSSQVLEFTDADFEAEVLQSPLPTLVEFWAPWSAPSRALAPTTQKLASEYAGKLVVGRLNIDHNQITPQQYSVRTIPTMLLFKQGKVVESIVGALPYSRVKAEIVRHLS